MIRIAEGVHAAGGGMYEVVSGFIFGMSTMRSEWDLMEKCCAAGNADVPVALSVFPQEDIWNGATMEWLEGCHDKGLPVYGVCSVKAIGGMSSMESNINPFMSASPTYLELSQLPREARLHELNSSAVRSTVINEAMEARENKRWLDGGTGTAAPNPPGSFGPLPASSETSEGVSFSCRVPDG